MGFRQDYFVRLLKWFHFAFRFVPPFTFVLPFLSVDFSDSVKGFQIMPWFWCLRDW